MCLLRKDQVVAASASSTECGFALKKTPPRGNISIDTEDARGCGLEVKSCPSKCPELARVCRPTGHEESGSIARIHPRLQGRGESRRKVRAAKPHRRATAWWTCERGTVIKNLFG